MYVLEIDVLLFVLAWISVVDDSDAKYFLSVSLYCYFMVLFMFDFVIIL